MDYLQRYQNGEYEQVWNELQAVGRGVRQEPHLSQARAVAAETMRRVRRNCEILVARLQALGYVFGTYPDGTKRSYPGLPHTPPSLQMQADIPELKEEAGTLPLSLVAFWEEVGAVDFVGRHPAWGDGLDPLVIDPPEGALSFLYEEDEGEWFCGLAPDDLHKDNTSGGDPYGLKLPCRTADFAFIDERSNPMFVSYLRHAILQCGGFPGIERLNPRPPVPIDELTAGLEPF